MTNKYSAKHVQEAFIVWWFLYGEELVDVNDMLNNPIICSGFAWDEAVSDGYLIRYNKDYALTPQAIQYIQRMNNEHRTNKADEATPCERVA